MSAPFLVLAALSLTNFVVKSVEDRIARADPAKALCRFTGYPMSAPHGRFTANPAFWLKGVDFSCVSPWNGATGRVRAGTAISRRHIVFAAHFPLWKGTRILFTDDENGVCPCTLAATRTIGGTDIAIGLLNAELTPNIRPAKILPENYAEYIGNGEGLPTATFNQNELVFLGALNAIQTNATWKILSSRGAPKGTRAAAFRETLIVGDSGNPAFLIVGDEAVLLYCLRSGGAGGGPALHRYRREIQAAMDELCPGYTLESHAFRDPPATGPNGLPAAGTRRPAG